MLVGRQREIGVLGDLISRTPADGAVLVMPGDPGIGKSALLRTAQCAARAHGLRVLRLTGVEAEATYPFAGLHQMLRPVLGMADRLTGTERAALMSAFGLAEGPQPDRFAVALAVTHLLAALAAGGPVVVLADDAQWLDPHTHEVLAFVGRRLSGPVVLIAALRTGHPGPLVGAGFPELLIDGVDEAAAAHILSAHGSGLRAAERNRILREACGNPLALIELPAALRLSPAPGERWPPNLPGLLERAFAGRVRALPPPTRDTLLVAAVDSADDLSEILSAAHVLRGESVTRADLEPAAVAGLLIVGERDVRFRHPLMRSAVVQAESLQRLQAANAALADVLPDEPYRRTWHRAQSIVGPDDRIADALETNAGIALSRGAVMTAINDLERSAQLTTPSARRGHRLLAAAEHAFGLGRADLVDHLLREAARTELSELDQARTEWLREIFHDGVPGDAGRVLGLCDSAARSAAAGDVDLALNLLLGAALRCWWAETGPQPRARVVGVLEALPGARPDPRHAAAMAVAEPVLRAGPVLDLLAGADRHAVNEAADADALRLWGMAAHAVGDEAASARLLGEAEARLRKQGRLGLLSQVLSMQVMVHLDLGNLRRAADCAREGLWLAAETEQATWRTGTLVCDAILQALRGNAEQALHLATEAELDAAPRRLNDLLSCVQLARGVAWLSAGRNRDAYRTLRRAFDPADASFHQRERFTHLMFLADAAERAGHRADARQVLDGLEVVARTARSPILRLHLSYARAVLAAREEDAEELYLAALGADLSSWPLVRAKTQLAYGRWLRRRHRITPSRTLLHAAQATFDRIGATAWADEARLELEATGTRPAWPVRTDPEGDHHDREERIGELLARGSADGEIAQALSLPVSVVALYRRKRAAEG
ncbi:ATP-binding protein [Streptomyces gilvus]|uniref:ATP-binding protein n=1 Tax=Streptomyces gilvus TaxID=2920937 RepID=UPI001F1062FA|nr:AAA family ATPase [Streptomyces sp. CME 23]MCH5676886.1 AAA family ATPase [Streptomyces sp. CME 23]